MAAQKTSPRTEHPAPIHVPRSSSLGFRDRILRSHVRLRVDLAYLVDGDL